MIIYTVNHELQKNHVYYLFDFRLTAKDILDNILVCISPGCVYDITALDRNK